MSNHHVNVLALALGGLFIVACPNDNAANTDANKDAVAVSNSDGPTELEVSAVDSKPTCVDNVLCIQGDHFDTTLCKCVPDTSPATCNGATDCTGALPALCQQCASGGTGCAHFTCVAGQCQVAYCP